MRIDSSRAAVRRYIIGRSRDGYPTPEVPEKYGPVHAVLIDDPRPWRRRRLERFKHLHQIEYIEHEWNAAESVCGIRVRVVYPMAFDTEEDEACKDCKNLLVVRSMDIDVYMRQRAEILRGHERAEILRGHERPQPKRRQGRPTMFEALDEFYDQHGDRSAASPNPGARLSDPWVFRDLHRKKDDAAEEQGESA